MKRFIAQITVFTLFASHFMLFTSYAETRGTPGNALPAHSHPHSKGPHGGEWVKSSGRDFEVKVDKEAKQLDVFTSSTAAKPRNMSVTLYKDKDTNQTIQLKTVPITHDGFYHYQGSLDPSQTPYIAIGVQFDLSSSEE